MIMEVDFDASDFLDQEIIEFEENNDNSNFEGERCGICMDIIVDRGVLDCCQHWFCFDCIDNWATITNLCPLCQNEFQLITCVPVYDTVGNNKIDDDSSSRDDEWSIEGTNNTLSFPSYYIDENAVICLDGDECKIRSGLANIEDDSNLDTSIACDSCDIWYHAFCVGFDTEDTSEDTWLCPRCMVGEIPQKSDATSKQRPSHLSGAESGHTSCLHETTFCGKLSVAVADDGETAMVVSMVDGSKGNKEATEKYTALEVDEDLKVDGDSLMETVSSNEKKTVESVLDIQGVQLSLSQNTSSSQPSASLVIGELKTNSVDGAINRLSSTDGVKSSLRKLLDESKAGNKLSETETETTIGLHLGLSVNSSLSDEKILPDAEKEAGKRIGSKRSRTNRSVDVVKTAADEEDRIKNEAAASQKKLRTKGKFQMTRSKDQSNEFFKDDSRRRTTQVAVPEDAKLKKSTEKEDVVPDIMSIVQGIGRRPKGLLTQNSGDKSSKERESTAGLRVKKIMRRATEIESSDVVQKLRKEIREAVRNRSSTDIGENLFDPNLLAAFRTVVAGPTGEAPAKLPPPALKAKKLLLQKGKVRENLTKKIYGNSNGRRKRAWDRECEVEFWKHRCMKASKPEKIATLKSVLDLLRKNHEGSEEQTSGSQSKTPILSRLYLADTSVFPRKNDIKPLSAHTSTNNSEQNSRQLNSMEKGQNSSHDGRASELTQTSTVSLKLAVPSVHDKGSNDKLQSSKGKATASNHGSSQASLGGLKVNSQKEKGIHHDRKIDKRKWAMEVLARKKAATGTKAMLEKEEDNAKLKGNYPLLAQLPIDMRPVPGQSRHNKIPLSVRQTQVYRLTEHFLRKVNLPEIRRTAETELAVADAINIEKGVADRSSSKLVYLNLCSQELLHRSENSASVTTTEPNSSSSSLQPIDQSEQANESDAAVHDALKNAGLISDSPPSSPRNTNTEKANEVVNSPLQNKEDEPENIFEIDSHPEEDIYGDFEYDIEDEDYIGAAATKVAKVPLEEPESRLKVVFSTLKSENLTDHPKDQKRSDDIEESKLSTKGHTDTGTVSSTTEDGTDKSSAPPRSLPAEDGEELSLAECEELYGPDKEPLHNLPEETRELVVHANVPIKESVSSQVNRESSSNLSHTSENVRRKDKSEVDTIPVSKKVEMYIKEHIRPLCKTGIITAEQYRWAVAKTTDKVMKFHQNAKNASFLIKEGEKVKKLAEQYLETAPQK
ncbi:uncharacterized protein At4g10930 isoform X2 [Euphorbia lathyris]|uniref:uncharacterized protein At4g10930 isoform X2 n=1 Tax=Euphorbia lathyris TaxID=212925 RepID=UPI0033134313